MPAHSTLPPHGCIGLPSASESLESATPQMHQLASEIHYALQNRPSQDISQEESDAWEKKFVHRSSLSTLPCSALGAFYEWEKAHFENTHPSIQNIIPVQDKEPLPEKYVTYADGMRLAGNDQGNIKLLLLEEVVDQWFLPVDAMAGVEEQVYSTSSGRMRRRRESANPERPNQQAKKRVLGQARKVSGSRKKAVRKSRENKFVPPRPSCPPPAESVDGEWAVVEMPEKDGGARLWCKHIAPLSSESQLPITAVPGSSSAFPKRFDKSRAVTEEIRQEYIAAGVGGQFVQGPLEGEDPMGQLKNFDMKTVVSPAYEEPLAVFQEDAAKEAMDASTDTQGFSSEFMLSKDTERVHKTVEAEDAAEPYQRRGVNPRLRANAGVKASPGAASPSGRNDAKTTARKAKGKAKATPGNISLPLEDFRRSDVAGPSKMAGKKRPNISSALVAGSSSTGVSRARPGDNAVPSESTEREKNRNVGGNIQENIVSPPPGGSVEHFSLAPKPEPVLDAIAPHLARGRRMLSEKVEEAIRLSKQAAAESHTGTEQIAELRSQLLATRSKLETLQQQVAEQATKSEAMEASTAVLTREVATVAKAVVANDQASQAKYDAFVEAMKTEAELTNDSFNALTEEMASLRRVLEASQETDQSQDQRLSALTVSVSQLEQGSIVVLEKLKSQAGQLRTDKAMLTRYEKLLVRLQLHRSSLNRSLQELRSQQASSTSRLSRLEDAARSMVSHNEFTKHIAFHVSAWCSLVQTTRENPPDYSSLPEVELTSLMKHSADMSPGGHSFTHQSNEPPFNPPLLDPSPSEILARFFQPDALENASADTPKTPIAGPSSTDPAVSLHHPQHPPRNTTADLAAGPSSPPTASLSPLTAILLSLEDGEMEAPSTDPSRAPPGTDEKALADIMPQGEDISKPQPPPVASGSESPIDPARAMDVSIPFLGPPPSYSRTLSATFLKIQASILAWAEISGPFKLAASDLSCPSCPPAMVGHPRPHWWFSGREPLPLSAWVQPKGLAWQCNTNTAWAAEDYHKAMNKGHGLPTPEEWEKLSSNFPPLFSSIEGELKRPESGFVAVDIHDKVLAWYLPDLLTGELQWPQA
ncbi:uncharacterized protein BXZ73DRAFT_74785 [Epithele typhae]|uniref:uncharacterized protein n=1 Tax=Epithele typhae TaxID=378194 RepID=UPI002008C31F|nr:uncharacterized protein BXZ73DRAFT_74785 [Epithele typhae]KAH9942543.1 hypothetical protein BXZ73DRAFT_74785 [Epithele typhae]